MSATARQPAPQPPEKPRLTEEEKKSNHIASEQKRREAIRLGFDRLASLVPGMEGQGRSEANVLERTILHMEELIRERDVLVDRAREKGMDTAKWELPESVTRVPFAPDGGAEAPE